jgi:hypothetical protein
VFCFELFLSGVNLKVGGAMASSSDNKGKGPWVDDHQRQKWKEEQGSGRARPKNPAFEGPTKARRIFSHDLQGPTYHVLDLNSMPVIEEGMLITYALFGCTEMISGIELSDNSKSRMERKWLTIQILLFGWL